MTDVKTECGGGVYPQTSWSELPHYPDLPIFLHPVLICFLSASHLPFSPRLPIPYSPSLVGRGFGCITPQKI